MSKKNKKNWQCLPTTLVIQVEKSIGRARVSVYRLPACHDFYTK